MTLNTVHGVAFWLLGFNKSISFRMSGLLIHRGRGLSRHERTSWLSNV